MKKRKFTRKQIITAAVVALIIVIFVVSRVAARRAASNSGQLADDVTEGTVTRGNITRTVTGTGSLAADDDSEVEVPVGVHVEKVMVEAGDTVKKGDTIATVTKLSVQEQLLEIQNSIDSLQSEIDSLKSSDDNYELTKEVKNGEKEKLIEDRRDMEALLRTCKLTSTAEGTVHQLALEDDEDISKGALSTTSDSDASASSSSGVDLSSLLSGTSSIPQKEGSVSSSAGTEQAAVEEPADKLISTTVGFYIVPPVTGIDPMTDEQINSAINRNLAHYTASISWDPADKPFKEKTAYTATVTLTADDGYSFPSSTENVTGENTLGLVSVALDGKGTVKKLVITQKYDETMPGASTLQKQLTEIAQKAMQDTMANASAIISSSIKEMVQQAAKGSSSLDLSSIAGLSGRNLSDYAGISGLSGTSDLSGLSGLSSDTGALSGLSGVDTQGSSSYNVYKTVGMTVTPDTKAMIDIDVDEMDINSLKNGQAARVTIDALGDETFSARITKIADSTSNSDGVAKFKVHLEMDKTDEMKYGMSASASITVSSKRNVLLVPMDAIQTVDGENAVYTAVDTDGNPSDPKTVETGVSDGENVEVTSGLDEGQAIYYRSTGTYDAVESVQNERDSMREEAQENADSSQE